MNGDSPYLDPHMASAYARLAAPSQLVLPARDLVGLLDVPIGATVLDVGSATGVVAAALPKVAFEAVTASFVISHLVSYADGLVDMSRVCKPGGRVGVTAWGTLPNPA